MVAVDLDADALRWTSEHPGRPRAGARLLGPRPRIHLISPGCCACVRRRLTVSVLIAFGTRLDRRSVRRPAWSNLLVTSDSEHVARGFCTAAGSGMPLPAAGGEALAGAAATAGRITVIHSEAPAGDEVPLHLHHDVDECLYVLGGHYRVTCGSDVFEADAGSLVFLPHGVPHAYTVGREPARKLIIAAPGGLEEFFRDMENDAFDLDRLQHEHRVTFL